MTKRISNLNLKTTKTKRINLYLMKKIAVERMTRLVDGWMQAVQWVLKLSLSSDEARYFSVIFRRPSRLQDGRAPVI